MRQKARAGSNRELLEGYVAERRSVLEQIEQVWAAQHRRPTTKEVENRMGAGRR